MTEPSIGVDGQRVTHERERLRRRPRPLEPGFVLIDSRHGILKADEEMFALLDESAVTFQLVLTKAGFTVESTSDGEAGLAAARAHPPDLILLDFVMPKMNGYQVCRELAGDRLLRDVPVVVGGIIPPEDEKRLLEFGVARVYTPKDYDLNAIMAGIVTLVDQRSQAA